MSRLIKHFRRWNIWRKHNVNHKLHKFLVLIGFTKSPTMTYVLLSEELEELEKIDRAFSEGLKRGGIDD